MGGAGGATSGIMPVTVKGRAEGPGGRPEAPSLRPPASGDFPRPGPAASQPPLHPVPSASSLAGLASCPPSRRPGAATQARPMFAARTRRAWPRGGWHVSGRALRPTAAATLELCLRPAPPARARSARVSSPSRRAAGGACAAGDVCPALGGQACAFPCGVLREWPRAGAACTRSARSTGRARALGARERAPLSLRSVSSAGGQDGRWPSCLRGRGLDGDARSVCPAGTYFGLRSGSLLHLPRGRPGLWGEMAGPGLLCGSAISVAIWGSALQPEGGRDTSDLRGDQGRQLRSEAVSGRRAGLPSGTLRAASCVTFTTVSGSRVIGLSVLLRCAWETRYHESAFFRSGNFNI